MWGVLYWRMFKRDARLLTTPRRYWNIGLVSSVTHVTDEPSESYWRLPRLNEWGADR